MDERLQLAVRASLAWYADVFQAHGIRTRVDERLWRALEPPPRWHSAAKTLVPGVGADEVARAVVAFPGCSVADSFATLDLSDAGFGRLFAATWLYRPPAVAASAAATGLPDGWFVLTDRRDLAEWNAAHDTDGVLLPVLLEHPRFRFLARRASGRLVAGAVLHRAPGAVELSNTWVAGDPGETGGALAEAVACADALLPGEPLVGYAQGEELANLTTAGFQHCGEHVVWVREAAPAAALPSRA